jgi:hypothetical protein
MDGAYIESEASPESTPSCIICSWWRPVAVTSVNLLGIFSLRCRKTEVAVEFGHRQRDVEPDLHIFLIYGGSLGNYFHFRVSRNPDGVIGAGPTISQGARTLGSVRGDPYPEICAGGRRISYVWACTQGRRPVSFVFPFVYIPLRGEIR